MVGTVSGDQGAIEQACEHLLAGTAFDVVREPSDLAVGVFNCMGQHGVLGGVKLDGHDVILICFGVVMNALFGSEAKSIRIIYLQRCKFACLIPK